MFTGLVHSAGEVEGVEPRPEGGARITLCSPVFRRTAVGDSIAVNGCCLTVTAVKDETAAFDLLGETLRLTNLGGLLRGSKVNLEPSLLPTDRMGGHFVTGHIDACGTVKSFAPHGGDWRLEIEAPGALMRHIVPKGCVTVDGMSLTVAEVAVSSFVIWIIPHTLSCTNLPGRRAGDRVNLESDLLAKYAEKLLNPEGKG
ncbi:MAG: riboflavin synthase [Opitutales bacterium]